MNNHVYPNVAIYFISTCIIFGIGVYSGTMFYHYTPWHTRITQAVAVIHPTQGSSITGTVLFTQEQNGIRVTAICTQLTPGKHGFHIHEHGDCSCADGMCTGDHFNPTHSPHGGPQSKERHVGDFGNLEADASGIAHLEFVDTHIELNGPHSIIGRSIIVHAQPDDLISQPSGNAGARIGCGVIGRR